MQHNWLAHWEQGYIPFHLYKVNPLLEKYWPQLHIMQGENILVPLCGKTKDLLWLANQGLHVIGVELSHIACEAFFIENKLEFNTQKIDCFTHYYNNQIEIFCGDFFALTADMIPTINAVYDRAALIALPETLRQRYAQHLVQLMMPVSQMLLIVYNSAGKVQGPPYPVAYAEIQKLFGREFQIVELEYVCRGDLSQHLRDKGYCEVYEGVYGLKRESTS